ncbi:lysozyme C-like [Varroa jacobsoni]|uniref:lysozyme C-like n=1 Tax=Varroa jacobsoni TaxID=62625 RepID=UPI000BF368FF|nr:lysozyme C-like [Varroa jacobsoni]
MFKDTVVIVVMTVLTFETGSTRVVERCELAQKVARHTPYKDAWHVKQFVCIVAYVSGYNTSKVISRQNQQQSYGIFQFPSKFYCLEKPQRGRVGVCHRLCDAFKDDDIRDDVECAGIAMAIYGFRFWKNWLSVGARYNRR